MKEDVSLERRRDILNIYPRLRLLQTELVKKKKKKRKKSRHATGKKGSKFIKEP